MKMAKPKLFGRSLSEGSSSTADQYAINNEWKKCLLINNLNADRKAQLFRDLLENTFGFEVTEHSNLSAEQIEEIIQSIPQNFVPVPNGVFFLVILVQKGDSTVVCGIDDKAVLVRDIMHWINNASMPTFRGIPRIVIYFSEEDFNPLNYSFNRGNAEVADLFAVWINDASFRTLRDCDAVCAALTQDSPRYEFSDIFKRLGCTAIYSGFRTLRLTPI